MNMVQRTPMDRKKIDEIRAALKELVGPEGAYVLMVHDGSETQAWTDGRSRIVMRGLLETGIDCLHAGLSSGSERIQT
jgi:hypothetical protein